MMQSLPMNSPQGGGPEPLKQADQDGFQLKPGHNGASSGPAPFVKQDADTSEAENGASDAQGEI